MITSDSTNWQIEDAGPQHLNRIRELFRTVFDSEMSEDHWHWKYANGRGRGIVVLKDHELVAFFGGTERRVVFENRAIVAMQCGDSMVAEAYRGILTRKGPFYHSVTAFLGKYVGEGLPYLLSYGFPNARAMRLARRLALYDDVGGMLEIDWLPRASAGYRSEDFDFLNPSHQRLADELWITMAADFKGRAIGIRDYAYLKQRFHDNPSLRYEYHLVFETRSDRPLGLLITRQTDEGLLLVDLLAGKTDLKSLVQFARQRAWQLGCNKLFGWLTEIDYSLVSDTEPLVRNEPLRLPLGVWSPGLTAEDVRDKWFFVCGDSDFL